jgi:hypothetical protein
MIEPTPGTENLGLQAGKTNTKNKQLNNSKTQKLKNLTTQKLNNSKTNLDYGRT